MSLLLFVETPEKKVDYTHKLLDPQNIFEYIIYRGVSRYVVAQHAYNLIQNGNKLEVKQTAEIQLICLVTLMSD